MHKSFQELDKIFNILYTVNTKFENRGKLYG